jgi:methionine sulfoxide reductase heme-binding subunit
MRATTPALPPQPLTWPWQDRQGRLSALRAGCFALLCLPALYVLALALAGELGPEPLKAAMKEIGRWTIRLLLVTLAVTPAARLAGMARLASLRRMLGLGTLAYGVLHLLLYAWNEGWGPWHIAQEIATRFYLTLGFVALLGLGVLGWTSTDAWLRRLGPGWKRLHRLVWPIALLAVWHFFLQSKSLVFEAVIAAGVLGWLAAWRLLPAAARLRPAVLLLLAPVAAAIAALAEYGFFALATRLPASRIAAANLDPGLAPRPVHWVLALGVLVTALVLLRRRAGGAGRQAPSP